MSFANTVVNATVLCTSSVLEFCIFMDITYNLKVNQINKCTIYFKIYHQSRRGLRKKACELLSICILPSLMFYAGQNII